MRRAQFASRRYELKTSDIRKKKSAKVSQENESQIDSLKNTCTPRKFTHPVTISKYISNISQFLAMTMANDDEKESLYCYNCSKYPSDT